MQVTICYYPEWRQLIAAELDFEDTPVAHDDVQDDDLTPYRRDYRTIFTAIPNNRTQTHQAVLSLESDDEKYRLFIEIIELADDTIPQTTVYRAEVPALRPQTLAIRTADFVPTTTPVRRPTIYVELVEMRPADQETHQ